MKTFTTLVSVNRLLTSLFTFILLISAGNASALTTKQTVLTIGGAVVNNGIEYASLAANATNKSVFINWVTASEQNNSHFEVERSLDMKDFKTVAMVLDGFAAEGTGKKYMFKEDAGEVRNGKTVYYRLKQIDTDNKVHYSTVMAVKMNTTDIIFPNQETINANTTGKILLSKQSIISTGIYSISVEGSDNLSAGILDARFVITETAFNYPKLVFA